MVALFKIAYRLVETSIRGVLLLLSINLCMIYNYVFAQTNTIQFEHLTDEHGLSQNTIFDICRDQRGFLWIGTYEGLNRYDGYNFKIYKRDAENPSSLNSNRVRVVYEDRSGEIWIGTDGGGLNKFDRETDTFIHYTHDPHDPKSICSNRLNCILEDRFGVLWIGTDDGGLNEFDRETKTFMHYLNTSNNPNSLSENKVISIYEDSKSRLWVITNDGLRLFDRKGKRFNPYSTRQNDLGEIDVEYLELMYEDRFSSYWIGSIRDGLKQIDRKAGRTFFYQHDPDNPHSISDNSITAIHEDRLGRLWIGTKNGLNIFDRINKRFIRYKHNQNDPSSIGGNVINVIHEDPMNIGDVLWIAGDGAGLNKLRLEKKPFKVYIHNDTDDNSLNSSNIMSIYEDPDESGNVLWIGTNGGGLNKYDRETGKFTHYTYDPNDENTINSNVVRAICKDRNGILWLATENGIATFNRKTQRFTRYLHDPSNSTKLRGMAVFTLFQDKGGTMWTGGWDTGLAKYDQVKDQFCTYMPDPKNPHSINSSFIWSILEDPDEVGQVLWVGTHDGGFEKFNRKTGEFTHYTHDRNDPKSICHNTVLSIHKDKDSNSLWIATAGGLDKFNRETEIFTHYSEEDGLPSNAIQSILFDDHGKMWIATRKGLSKFDPKTEKFKNYETGDGIQGNTFFANACYKSAAGEMMFGGSDGLVIFHPDSIKDDMHIPNVVITDFSIFNKSVPITKDSSSPLQKSISEIDEITLSHKRDVFSFEFAALHFTSPKKNQYAYMMEGFEKSWNYVDASKRFATYTNLDPGEYVFKVKASNSDGIWNELGTSIKLVITPPFWQTWWFRILAILTIASFIIAIYQTRTRAIRVLNKQLEERVEKRTLELKTINKELRDALTKVKTLSGLVPICSSCKKVRDDKGYWNQVEDYVHAHSQAEFSHSICPECLIKLYPDFVKRQT